MNKLRNSNGMTLSEVLVATIIMLLVSMGLVTGVALSNKQFVSSIKSSEAEELYSTLSSLISNELRYTTNIITNGTSQEGYKVVGFTSSTFSPSSGDSYIVLLDKDGRKLSIDTYGQIALGNDETFNRLLGAAAYTYNLGAKITIYYNSSTNTFKVNLEIGTINGDSVITNRPFTVRALNTIGGIS